MSDLAGIETLWSEVDFTPNESQRKAILHKDGPLFLTAGPGSGKTRVLLWRTVNLIAFHNFKPEEIFLSTFTEKAAFQLREGLRTLLGLVTNHTNVPYDLSKMYVGTVHSLCQKLIADRRFSRDRRRIQSPVLLDELSQYFHLYHPRSFQALMEEAEIPKVEDINEFFGIVFKGQGSSSRHSAVTNCISLFNRVSEECLDYEDLSKQVGDGMMKRLLRMYGAYRVSLAPAGNPEQVDFSLLQQKAFDVLSVYPDAGNVFKHVIIDEYQDTNTIQEKIFFRLADGSQNICVVGDDDQALYRFRGATVENFVQFPQRVEERWRRRPTAIPLNTNYRSRKLIVDFYTSFIDQCDWSHETGGGHYRIADKEISAHSDDSLPSVVASGNTKSADAFAQIAQLVRNLIDTGKVQDPSQIAFLFPSVKGSVQVQRMKAALESLGLLVYAPRAGRFLEVDEAVAVFGVFLAIFGKPSKGDFTSRGYDEFFDWIQECSDKAKEIIQLDPQLARYIHERRAEVERVVNDYNALMAVLAREGWELDIPYDIDSMKRKLYDSPGLSQIAKKTLGSYSLESAIKRFYEGVIKTEAITREHFRALYDNEPVTLIPYDGSRISRVRNFAASPQTTILVMTIDAFNSKSNNLYKASEKLPGERLPYQYIQETRPIIILDEPQSIDTTEKARSAIRTLHPLFGLRYSATHRNSPNLVISAHPQWKRTARTWSRRSK